MNFNSVILSGVFISLGTLTSCKEDRKSPTEIILPPVTCYNVKESKTYIFTDNQITDSVIFRLTFDNQNRILSKLSVKEDIQLELNYSDSTVIQMNHRVKSTNKVGYFTHYILNSVGYARLSKLYAPDSSVAGTSIYVYDKAGHKNKEYFYSGIDSQLTYNGTWQNECVTQFFYPNYETQVVASYTNYPDNRNLGFWQFLRDKSYYLVDKEVYSTRGSVSTYQYVYQFDGLQRPIKVTIAKNGVKMQEKYYTYY